MRNDPVWLLGLVAVLFQTVDMLLVIAVDTLFLRRLGAAWLPYAYVAVNAAAMGVALTVLSLKGLSTFRLARTLTLAFAVTALASLPFLDSTSALAFFAVFLVVRLHDKLCFSYFLTYVQGVFPVREGKEKIARILGASSIACVLAGLAVRPLIVAASIRAPFVLAAALSGLLVAAMVACERLWPPHPAPAGGASGPERLRDAFGLLRASGLARHLAGAFLVTMVLRLLLEFQFSRTVVALYPDDVALASFTGTFKAGMSLAFTLAQLFLTGWLLARLLPGGTMVAVAGTQVVLAALAIAVAGPLPSLLMHATWTIGYQACLRPASGLLLAPLSAGTRDRVGILTSLADSAGCVLSGAFLIACQSALTPAALFAGVLVLYLVSLALTRPLNADYLAALEESLATGDAGARESSLVALDDLAPERAAAQLARLSADPDPAVRRTAAARAALLPAGQAVPLLQALLARESDERHLADLIEVLKGEVSLPLAVGYLDHPARRVQAAAVLSTVRLARDRAALQPALGRLARMLSSPDEASRAAAVAVLGELRNPAFAAAAQACLSDGAEPVRRTAVRALEKLRPPPSGTASPLARALQRLSATERARVSAFVKTARRTPRMLVLERLLARELPALPLELLEMVRSEPDPGLVAAVAACLDPLAPTLGPLAPATAYLARVAPLVPASARVQLIADLVAAYRRDAASADLATRRARLAELLVRVAAVEAPADPGPLARSLEAALGDDRHRASMSIDLLESRLTPPVFRLVGPLLERWRDEGGGPR